MVDHIPANQPKLSEEEAWLKDVEQTARAVLRQNRVLPTKPVELTAEEVLRLVAGYRRSSETPTREQLLQFAKTVLAGTSKDGLYNGRSPDELWGELFP